MVLALLVQYTPHSSYWVVFATMRHMLDNLEAPYDNTMEEVAPTPQPIPTSMTIEGGNNI